MEKITQILGLILFLLISAAVAVLGSLITDLSVQSWYPLLKKPLWTPPGATIGMIWGVLYLIIAIAGWLIWLKPSTSEDYTPLVAYAVQMVLNLLWSVLFFGFRSPGLALIEIGFLWVAILVNIVLFWRVTPIAGALLIPYIGWVSFAAYLNAVIWNMNR